MATRSYKRGASDTMLAFNDLLHKQEAALNFVGEEIQTLNDKIQSHGNNIDSLCDHISNKEKLAFYSITPTFDIEYLEKEEKIVLIGILYLLANDTVPTHYQQEYIRSIQKYLNIKDYPAAICLDIIENIENLTTQKAMYQTILEYLSLQDSDYYDETVLQTDLLNLFNLNKKTCEKIKSHVELTIKIVGLKGLSEKYSSINFEAIDELDSNEPEDDANDMTEKNTATEHYEGIPLKVIEDLKACDSNVCFETKDYFFVGKGIFKIFRSELQDIISYNKSTKSYKTITSIPKDSAAALAHKSNLFISPGTDQLYVTDYENNILFYLYNNVLHKIDLESDSCTIFDNIELDDTIRSMQLYNNKIVMCSYDNLYLFDIEKKELQLITDSSEKSIGGTVSTATILNDIIYFYSSCGEKICADDGGSIKNCICAYDIKNKILKRIISISVDKLFTAYNDVYAIRNSDDYQGYELCKIIKNEKEYELMKITEYSCPHTKITENYLLCYYDSDIYCKNEDLFSIFAFDFRKQTFEKIVTDCYSYRNEGILKTKWTKERSQYRIFGNWIYYYKDHICGGYRSKEHTTRHIYRTNVNYPLQPVDLGEYNSNQIFIQNQN